ncbi:hypothetical protein ACIPRL_36725 [Streptomyces sp. NPDC090085]|uniref:hypothetical protein n=1 Tax=Streptomyces sp. NPDC090085 TaxID=3365943 RepID=UPI0038181EF6
MGRSKQFCADLVPGLPGDISHALASLHGALDEPVGRPVPFDRLDAFLTRPGDIAFTARVGMFC